MTVVAADGPRERILHAALDLLERGGLEALSTRAVSAAAGVQAPTLYRQFGDMEGLLKAVARAGFTTYLAAKAARAPLGDPVEDLREGWDRHVAFGLSHPHLYTLMYRTLRPAEDPSGAQEGAAILRRMVQRVAEAGRLAVGVERAAAMIHAAGQGTTLTLLDGRGQGDRGQDDRFSALMREAVLTAILTPAPGAPDGDARRQAAAHAVSLAALLPQLPGAFSAAEQALLLDWLQRLA